MCCFLSLLSPSPLPLLSPHPSSLSPLLSSSSAEPTEEQPPDVATPQQQVVIQPAEPQGDLLGGNLLDLLDISPAPPAAATTYNPAVGGGGMFDASLSMELLDMSDN